MTNGTASAAPAWLRIVALLALLWNLIGCYEYLVSVGVLPGERMADGTMPVWVTAAFALSVFSGALGSLGLLLLKRWAKTVLLICLAALLVQDLWAFVLREQAPDKGLALPLIVNLVAILLVWLAFFADRRGWLEPRA